MLTSCVHAQAPTPTPYSVLPVPELDASFLSDLKRHLWFEKAAEDGFVFADSVYSGGIHGSAAGKVGTFTGFLGAFIDGQIQSDAAASIDYDSLGAADNDTVWVIACKLTSVGGGNFVQSGSTHFWVDHISATKPAITGSDTPQGFDNNCIYLMKVTISGGAITAVADLRTQAPFVYAAQATSEVTSAPLGFFLYDTDDEIMYYWDSTAWSSIPTGDASGCSECGDSATAFFTTGQLEAARGGTGIDTSGSTGVPQVVAGTWTVPAIVITANGGTGLDTSSSSGYWHLATGTPTIKTVPDFRERIRPGDIAVDGTNCTQVTNEATIETGVSGSAFRCSDNNSSSFSFVSQVSDFPSGDDFRFDVIAVNNSTDSGDVVIEMTCMCESSDVDSSNFPAQENITLTFDGTDGEIVTGTNTMACGGTCSAESTLFFDGEIGAVSTDFTGTLENDVSFLYIVVEIPQSELGT